MSIADLTDIFGLFGQGLLVGMGLLTIFFIVGFVINFLYDLIRHA